MFTLVLLSCVGAATLHFFRSEERTSDRAGELLLRWVLAGYCGIPMMAVALLLLVHPHEMAEWVGVAPDHPFGLWLGWAYLGMALSATLALRWGGRYLIGPAVVWAVFFLGATGAHLHTPGAGGHGALLGVASSHALVSVLLGTGLALGGAREY